MAKLPFTVSARTAKLIGQENFTNAEGAIIELVKNSYDADANTALIIFDNADELTDKHSLYIIDNGLGMTDSIIKNKWMQIGTEDKLQNYTSEGGRIKTGAKGIGRFALDRLGAATELRTTSKENKVSLFWSVDWKDFERVGLSINQVKATLRTLKGFDISAHLKKQFSAYESIQKVLDKAKFATGTILKITALKDLWSEKDLLSLFNNLEVLVPPLEQPEFSIYLFNTKNVQELGEVNTAYFDDYDYKVSATYLADEGQSLKVKITRNELEINALETSYRQLFDFNQMKSFPFRLRDFKAKEIDLDLSLKDLKGFSSVDQGLLKKIGAFDFTFYFLKNRVSDDKSENDLKKYPYRPFVSANRIAWLDKFGGVKIFRDGFRVRPYGEKGNDWLQLGERQAISPQGAGQRIGAYRIRPNQIAGTINISRIRNPYFNDKSGREGIQENDIFLIFKNLLTEIINLFERDRNIVMFYLSELYRERFKDEKDREAAKAEAERILKEKRKREQNKTTNAANQPTASEELLASAAEKYEQELEEKESEIRLLRGLASVGLIMSSSAHELRSLRQRIVPRTDYLKREIKKYITNESLLGVKKDDDPFYMIELMKDEDLKIKHWLDYSLNALKKDKRKRTNIDFNDYFKKFKSTWKMALERRAVGLHVVGNNSAPNTIQAFEVDLDTIFNNLLTNSLEALKGGQEKRVTINWGKVNDVIQIDFVDNGRGLSQEYRNNPMEIFSPYETSKRDSRGNIIGTGLGLYIVKSIIDEYNNATINIVDAQKGFHLRLTFPTRKRQ
jgi:signal transduction histidine kinase